MEETNVRDRRLISLILLITFSYSLATFKGESIKQKGVQKYVGRIKEYGRVHRRHNGRVHRRHSSFYIGLYGQNWVNFMQSCWELVMQLMRLNSNKLRYYLQGQRAMELILSAF